MKFISLATFGLLLASAPTAFGQSSAAMNFNRIATFFVCEQLDPNCNVDNETVAEIIAATEDGNTLVYTDAGLGVLGFIDIADPTAPAPLGTIDVGGEPTSVVVIGEHALVCVSTSTNFTEPSGIFHVVEIATQSVVRTGDLGGQPDATAVSPDGNYAAIAIENERDEDLDDGRLPQLPAGFLISMDVSSADVAEWTLTTVNLTGLDGVLYPSDPEPEFVDINENNIVAVTLQENNAIVLVDLTSNQIINSFSAGGVDLDGIDILENDKIEQNGTQSQRLREPDACAWIGTEYLATADEGDMDGGSRTFTIFDVEGNVVYTSGTEMEDWVTRLGHYPEARSENKGNEPEMVLYSDFNGEPTLFVNSERSSLVFVYDVSDVTAPILKQILNPGGVGPEGTFAIPSRNLVVFSNEVDERENKMRSTVGIFEYSDAKAVYPTIVSAEGPDGKFIPFGALSGLAAEGSMAYTIEDSFYKSSRIFAIDATMTPPTIVDAMRITDASGVFAATLEAVEESIPGITEFMINDDSTVNLDLEGIDVVDGGFWVVSEGRGTVGDVDRPVESLNVLVKLDESAVIEEVILLPDEVNAIQVRFGFEGVAVDGDNIVVTFQRAWTNETMPRLGIYNTETASWTFAMYPLDEPESQYGGWVGLSDIETMGNGVFLILERDNQGGPDAAIKKIYAINLGDYSMADGAIVEKVLVRDIMGDLMSFNGPVAEKVEGMAMDGAGNIWINNDNDGVDDNSGENLFINLGMLEIPDSPSPEATVSIASIPSESPGTEATVASTNGDAAVGKSVLGTCVAVILSGFVMSLSQ